MGQSLLRIVTFYPPPPALTFLGWGICFLVLSFSVAKAEIVITTPDQSVSVTLAEGESETVVASSIAAGSTLSNFTFSGAGTLTLVGRTNARLNLSQGNSGFTGTFVIDTGLVSAYNNPNALSTEATIVLTKGGGLMNGGGAAQTWSQNIQLRGNGSLKCGWSGSSTLTLTGVISDEGSSSGILTIMNDSGVNIIQNAANTYSGGTVVGAGGRLSLSSSGTPLGTGPVTMKGGFLNLNGQTITTGGLSGTGGTISGSGTWTWNITDGKTYTYEHSLSNLSWGVQGTGTQEFMGTGTLDAQVVQIGGTEGGNLILSGEKSLNLNGNWNYQIGRAATDSGTVLLKDNAQITSSGKVEERAFWIGNNGTATLTLRDNASINLSNLNHFAIAKNAGTGTLNVHDNAQITASGAWFVLADSSSAGNATMNMTGGTVKIDASFHMGAGTSVLNFSGGTIDIANEFLWKKGGTIHFNATTAGFGKIQAKSLGRDGRADLLAGKIDFGIAAGATVISTSALATFDEAFVTGNRFPAADTFSVSSHVFDIQDSGTAWSLAFSDDKAKRSETLTIAGDGEQKMMSSLTALEGEKKNWSEYGWVQLDLRHLEEGEAYQLELQLAGEGDFQELESFMNEMMAFDTSGIHAEVDSELSLLSIVGLTRNSGEDFAWFAYDLTNFNAQYGSDLGINGLMAYQVPEPGSCLLMLLGLLGIFYVRKRVR